MVALKRLAKAVLPSRSRAQIRNTLQVLRPYACIGNRVSCPCCGWRFRRFLPFGVQLRPGALCPKCRSLERHRLLWLYLTRATDLFSSGDRRVLHIASEPVLERRLRSAPNLHYVSMDLHSARAMCHADITRLPFRDNSFDVIICYHVLEHVADDGKAMREVFRVLNNAGWALLQSPIDLRRKATYEDLTVDSPQERERLFGQSDHVRVYGRDYKDRLEAAGFDVRLDDYVRTLPTELARRFGVDLSEDIYVCTKAAGVCERSPALTAPATAQH